MIRSSRLQLFPDQFWVCEKGFDNADHMTFRDLEQRFSLTRLHYCPQVYPFRARAKLFQYQLGELTGFSATGFDNYQQKIELRIRRERILLDAFKQLYQNKHGVIGNYRIQFVDQFGTKEEGIDAGGLMKEFMTKLAEQMFDPQFGYFAETESRAIYPSVYSDFKVLPKGKKTLWAKLTSAVGLQSA